MTTELPLDQDRLRTWIGRTDESCDKVTAALAQRFRATFDLAAAASGDLSAPPGIHWCLSPLLASTAALGIDGHPERGGFLPPVPLPRRMWAGGEVLLLRPLRVGDAVRRISTIDDVTVKQGRSGTLCFVTVRHDLRVDNETAIRERQDIVYRGVGGREPSSMEGTTEIAQWRRSVPASTVLLFRYSALTFNGHRIHYDRRYCEEQENYPGLVVHGPLQATLLLQLATEARGVEPARFTFRSAAPFFDTSGPIGAMARRNGSGLHLWTAGASGTPCMMAEAHWG